MSCVHLRRRTQLESEEIVGELVHQFLIPEVQKQFVRERRMSFSTRPPAF